MTSREPSPPGTDPLLALATQWAVDAALPVTAPRSLSEIWEAGSTAGLEAPGLVFAGWVVPAAMTGPLMPVVANAPTVDGMLSRVARYHPLFGSDALSYDRSAARGTLDLRGMDGGPAHSDSVVACFSMVVAALVQLGAHRDRIFVTLRRAATPTARSAFARAFPHVRFDARSDQLTVPAAHLDVELARGDREVLDLLDAFAESQLRLRRQSWSARVMDTLATTGEVGVDEVARTLAVSTRTLQLHLRTEGTSFSELTDARRRHRALTLLETTDLTATQVARRVGLSGPAAFNRAVRRWTGLSPTGYRTSRT